MGFGLGEPVVFSTSFFCDSDVRHVSLSAPLCLSLSRPQSYRILPELLQRLHATDRHGLQRVLPSILRPPGEWKRLTVAQLIN